MSTRSTPRDVSYNSKKYVVKTKELFNLEFYIKFYNYEAIRIFLSLEVSIRSSINYHWRFLEGSRTSV